LVTARVFLVLALAGLLGFGCGGKKTKEAVVPVPEEFRAQAMQFLQAGTETTAKASQGVPYGDLKAQVVSTVAAHDLMRAVWPKSVPEDAQKDFVRALEGWGLALELWALKIDKADNPTAPKVNGFDRYLAFGVEAMEVERHGKDFFVEAYRDKNFLPFDANIKILTGLAAEAFDAGREKLLSALEKPEGKQ
jgi:hypothetical protein